MERVKILLNGIDKVKEFENIVRNIACNMDIIRGRYVIDAKSIMGIFSLDLSQPLELVIYNDGEEKMDLNLISKFIVAE